MLDSLEAAGLVERVRSQRDRRVVLISLTGRGAELVAARRARFEPLWRGALAEFDEDDLLIAAAVLDRLREMFYDVADAEPPLPAEAEQARRLGALIRASRPGRRPRRGRSRTS